MKGLLYLILFILSASALGYLFFFHYRPQIIERGCAEIAAQSSDYLFKGKNIDNSEYSYESVRLRCLEDSLK